MCAKNSSKIFYKTFFDIDDVVYDVTNLILISSDKKYEIDFKKSKIEKLDINLAFYLKDKVQRKKNSSLLLNK